MTATPKPCVAGVLTLLLMAADTRPFDTRPESTRGAEPLEQVGGYAASLSTGETTLHAIAVQQGREYHVAARCSGGCDVDVRLFSPSGREIDRHVNGEGMPEVTVIAAASGRYRADVTMTACPIHRCTYTLAAFVR